ncbi:amino acid ABC transporter substrate-binding protein [Ottowia testudinis]|uniref:Amino acid ABC transporter substrate-binding protein n=1 Tax=Ottowia testudinis TaxID=2816950 RepID=A0A975CI72_9BURK|nr:amino acid ABC transporter substrate-binding protein [Ottowia testudinis]QTD46044.1 amino acid ABC transporter substrate-binding protein [Ottowia testudinis]
MKPRVAAPRPHAFPECAGAAGALSSQRSSTGRISMRLHGVRLISSVLALAMLSLAGAAHAQGAVQQSATLKRIAASGEVVLSHGAASIPFSFLEPGSTTPKGYVMDLCQRVVDEIKDVLKRPDLKIRYLAPEKRLDSILQGKADLECMATTNTVERQKTVSFSNHYFVTSSAFGINKAGSVKKLADLNGKRIAVAPGTTNEKLLVRYQEIKQLKFNLVPMKSTPDGVEMLMKGEADAVFSDESAIWGSANKNLQRAEVIGYLPEKLSIEPYGIIYRKDDPEFGKLIDGVLDKIIKSGEINTLYNRWFVDGQRTPYPMTIYMKDNIRRPSKSGQSYFGLM